MQKTDTPGLSPALIVLMSVATGLAVASNYYAQPLLETIATNFSLSVNQAGFIVTAAQLGYAVGLMFLVPLGDMFERRGLIVGMTLLAAGGMLITAMSQNLTMMIIGTALTGLFSVVAQLLVPLAATLAAPEKRGKVVGIIMSGLLLGILLARTVAGALATLGGWRTIYWVASALMFIMALVLWRCLPRYKQHTGLNYGQLLGSIFALFIHTPVLRTRALLGALSFANFSVLWTSMAFLLAAPPFGYSEATIGLFGLVGAAGALMATKAGQLADKGKARVTTSAGLVLLLLSWLPIAFGQHSIIALIIGIIVLDLAVQAVHVTNQSVMYRMMPEARNRLTAGYMTSYFIGGSLGSLISAAAYQHAGWYGVSTAGLVLCLLNIVTWLVGKRSDQPANQTVE
ncbi:MFS transporter [Yersinia pseudotuberculosis]|uniref:MFS transporter n=1 Tax=Yersinia pseudotuberculosis TaxID=633 RepID=UPI000F4D5B86|nr:MFS transporter [Yersinia pseudotuberculosis]AYX15488.1 MFS transporter [Yersinia pseudotuberculosis]MBO1609011.1 MFS transporter [Yersinia pseudotuberculosis]MBO1613106.1 MFS transporter [Yersinia pseudotuberculosis]MBO1623431.1 MFS transporter [Yersinia pseudotuberculosis]